MPCRVGAEASLEHYQTRKQHPLRGIRIGFNKPARSVSMTLFFFSVGRFPVFGGELPVRFTTPAKF